MRRLLQIGTFLFVLIAILAPLAELFDRWDSSGFSNDTEFATFALIFVLCLVLLVSKLISVFAQRIHLIELRCPQPSELWIHPRSEFFSPNISSLSSPPLRI